MKQNKSEWKPPPCRIEFEFQHSLQRVFPWRGPLPNDFTVFSNKRVDSRLAMRNVSCNVFCLQEKFSLRILLCFLTNLFASLGDMKSRLQRNLPSRTVFLKNFCFVFQQNSLLHLATWNVGCNVVLAKESEVSHLLLRPLFEAPT